MQRIKIVSLSVFTGLILLWLAGPSPAQADQHGDYLIIGELEDTQGQPIAAAEIYAHIPGEEEALALGESQEDGSWAISFDSPPHALELRIHRYHFEDLHFELEAAQLEQPPPRQTVLGIHELQPSRCGAGPQGA